MLTFHHHRCKCAERHTFGQSSSCSSPEGLYKHSEAPAGIWGRCKCTQPWVQAARGGCSSREPYRGIPIDLWRWVKCAAAWCHFRLVRVLLHKPSSVLFLLQRHPVLCVNCAVSKSGRVWDVPDCIFYHICPSLKRWRTFYNIDNVLMFTYYYCNDLV